MRATQFSRRLACAAGLALAACSQTAETSAADSRALTAANPSPLATPVMRERAVFAAG